LPFYIFFVLGARFNVGLGASNGIQFCYRYTEVNKAALTLYYLSLSGHVMLSEEPSIIILKAIARAKADIEKATAQKRKGKKKKRRRSNMRGREGVTL